MEDNSRLSIEYEWNLNIFRTYFIQYSHAKYLQAAFHENWLETNGTSCRIVSPTLKLVVANNALP